MRISLDWLKDYVDPNLSIKELVEGLTMLGLEVEDVEEYGQHLQGVVVASIKEVREHPNADRLKVCIAEAGGREYQIVCGAPNLREGMFSALALPGARLPNGMEIKETKIRGVTSCGMIAAEDELGLTDDHSGIIELEAGLETGIPLEELEGIRDTVLEISITPNRGDCNCVLGIAREVGLLCNRPVRTPSYEMVEEADPVEKWARIDIEDPEGCPRYVAGMIDGAEIKPSPFWIRYRIHKSGMRGINNIVDVTNYVMLELGQPLHAFDYHRLKDGKIIVKRARGGEIFKTLDGQVRELSEEVLLICDGEGAVAIAGIMGGLNSEISPSTKTILLESAFFDPVTIRRGSKYLGLQTEASFRFERCIDIQNVDNALKRALSLMRTLSGGRILKGILDVYPKRYKAYTISLSLKRARDFIGIPLNQEEAKDIFQRLGMAVEVETEDKISVTPPSFRPDVKIPEDLMEEIARVVGYENVQVTFPRISSQKSWGIHKRGFWRLVSEIMVGLGFQEVITYSFISPSYLELFKVPQEDSSPGSELRRIVRLKNPISIEQSVMRTSLLPGALGAAKYNLFQGLSGFRLFELGEVFFQKEGEDLPEEKMMLCALMTQPYSRDTWYAKGRDLDIWDIKGVAEALLGALSIRPIGFRKGSYPGYDPSLCVEALKDDRVLLRFGRVEKDILEEYDLKERGDIFVLEGDMDSIREAMPSFVKFMGLPRYPSVIRDISIVVEKRKEAGKIIDEIYRSGKGLVESVHIFDLYEGEKVGEDKKALGFRITFRSPERTLDGQEINQLMGEIIGGLEEKFLAKLRE